MFTPPVTVQELRDALARLPGDAVVVIDYSGPDETDVSVSRSPEFDSDGYVVIGTSHETPDFAVAAIRCWWRTVGRSRYPGAKRLLIQADGGGANDSRKWAWKVALQRLADELQPEALRRLAR